MIEFSNLAQAKAFYHFEEYSRARQLRAGAAIGQFIAIEGWAGGDSAASPRATHLVPA